MSIDMSQFYQVFFEETGEHLGSMENLLLGLDIADPDAEQLNAIFRAAHSIKGSSGTFGFTDMADVTHILENLLDRIRKGELALRNEMIDAFLAAGDVLKGMLAAHKGEGQADEAAAVAICQRLRDLTHAAVPATAAVAAAPVEALVAGQDGIEAWFVLDGDDGDTAIERLIEELGDFGAVSIINRPATPDRPWHLAIVDCVDAEGVRGVLEFLARSDSIRIGRIGETTTGDAADGAYGFFDEAAGGDAAVTVAPAACAPSGTVSTADDSYGFFEPLPAAGADAVPAADDSFGFFEPLPQSDEAAVVPADVVPAIAAGSEGDGFGFFVDVPPPAAAPAVQPVVAAAVAKPADDVAKKPPVKLAGGAEATIRVGVDKVDQLINLVGELVITQAMLAQSAAGVDPVEFERLHNGLTQLERNSRDLQEAVMSIRMMPISTVFSRFPRVVRDLAQKLGKQIELKTIGEETELDKSLIERISDPLTHLVRNSLDHGIEMPDARAAKGKQPVGTITLKAYHQSGNIVIEVGDDGAGLPRDKILAKARERGLNMHEQMTDAEVWQLIFEPGFSTADQVTDVSGRGVGMDVVKRNITAMGGRVEIESMLGVGTRMTVRLPLTLAILDGMSVAVGKETYIIPLGYVIESLQAERSMIKSVSGLERLIQVRGEYLPVVALHEVFGIPGAVRPLDKGIMVVLDADGVKAALFVDALVGQHQVVIKSLESNYRKVTGVSGATIMGDGHVALILDVSALVGMAKSAMPAAE
ncbi:MAG: chemotaxis protein CheW [Gammaproteobacteria bacterium]|nr:chemotaxis protein CheW [Gammaproteobacteria bacterium]MBU1646143.1 chemotaxis protein CheW [Gammaproteobacteria bacterium]MBU1972205.1 chemotaxis protein CheW [Gammaproteobacteria bacterium]